MIPLHDDAAGAVAVAIAICAVASLALAAFTAGGLRMDRKVQPALIEMRRVTSPDIDQTSTEKRGRGPVT